MIHLEEHSWSEMTNEINCLYRPKSNVGQYLIEIWLDANLSLMNGYHNQGFGTIKSNSQS